MSEAASIHPRMSPAEFLAWEREQLDRHQYLDGEIYAMAGGSPRHNLLAARVLARLDVALRGGPCLPFTSDQRLHVGPKKDYVYADAVVVCGDLRLHEGTTDVVENPRVIVEVLSSSTERHDRGPKWDGYRQLSSLTDYVLVSQRVPQIEHYAREPDGSWRYRVAAAGGRIELTTGTVLVVDDLYEGAFQVPGED